MTFGILFLLILILFSLSRKVWCARRNIFVPVTDAACQPEYAWMDNVEQQNPCLTVAYVISACAGGSWIQPALLSGSSYDSPNGTTATPCSCSWSCYNLMMACTLCQGTVYSSDITTWPSFSQNCPSNYKDEVFPKGYVLSDDTSIPYWATINLNWTYELFDIMQAENYAHQNILDYWPSNSSPNSSTKSGGSGTSANLSAIIGGTLGGIACLFLILIGCIFLCKDRQYRRLENTNDFVPIQYTGTPMTNTHASWASESYTVFSQTSSPSISYMTIQPQGMGIAGMSMFQSPSGKAHTLPASISYYSLSPLHSTTNLPPTSLGPPVLSSFTSHGQSVIPLLVDAVEVISPFLATSSWSRTNRSEDSSRSPRGKAPEVISKPVVAPLEQHAQLNPPPYFASVEQGQSRQVISLGRGLLATKQNRRKDSEPGSTMHLGHSRT